MLGAIRKPKYDSMITGLRKEPVSMNRMRGEARIPPTSSKIPPALLAKK
jgi:hypothetical protein